MATTEQQNRRRHPRTRISWPAIIEAGTSRYACQAADISAHGARIRTKARLRTGTAVRLEFIPPEGPSVRVGALVWRVEADGLAFLPTSQAGFPGVGFECTNPFRARSISRMLSAAAGGTAFKVTARATREEMGNAARASKMDSLPASSVARTRVTSRSRREWTAKRRVKRSPSCRPGQLSFSASVRLARGAALTRASCTRGSGGIRGITTASSIGALGRGALVSARAWSLSRSLASTHALAIFTATASASARVARISRGVARSGGFGVTTPRLLASRSATGNQRPSGCRSEFAMIV